MDFLSEYFFQNIASLFSGVLNNSYLFDLGNQRVLGAVIFKGRMWACKRKWLKSYREEVKGTIP